MCLLFLLSKRIGYVSTPNSVSVVTVSERFSYISTPDPVSVVPDI